MQDVKWVLAGLLAVWCSACVVTPLPDLGSEDSTEQGLRDGSVCVMDEDCRSKQCGRDRLCGHSLCDCPGDSCDAMGEKSKDCASGWVCAYYESILGDVGEVFGVEHDYDSGYCQPLCAGGCPEHYLCADGHFCRADDHWNYPTAVVSWSGDAEGMATGREGNTAQATLEQGKSVTLHASATSPIDAPITTYSWTVINGSGIGTMAQGPDLTLTQGDASYVRADLQVTDDEYRGAALSIAFNSCFGSGHPCGYQGSGCCRSCDDASDLCL
jgi:hypothetical protein